jgi:transcriptional regulator with XRE-family HTH domain
MTLTQTAPRPAEPSRSENIKAYEPVPSTTALSISADWLRTGVDMLHDDVRSLHGQTRALDLDDRAHKKATTSDVPALLEELAFSRGMSWADIAAAAQVSVSAIRKWRNGGAATAENRQRLARIASFLDILEDRGVADPAQWMEMALPLGPGYYIRPIDVFVEGHAEALIEMVEQRSEVATIIDAAVPGWRDQKSDAEVFVDTDGQRSLRLRTE